MSIIQSRIGDLLQSWGIALSWQPYIVLLILLTALVVIACLSLVITRRILVRVLHSFLLRTSTRWDDILVEYQVFYKLSYILPAFVFRLLAPEVFVHFEGMLPVVLKITDIFMVVAVVRAIVSFFKGMEFFLSSSPALSDKPLASYFQLARIIVYIGAGILMLSILLGRSPVYFLSAFGAMTAIILLIFKDTILGLVASVQISANDMVRVGDWVEMPKFHADGDVIAINLNTVKIRNWDKTITAIPTYYFITDSFKNWRGMQESGGRRIKRAIFINLGSVKFVDPVMRQRFERFYIIKDFIAQRVREIEQYNETHDIDTSELINGRRMTNIGVFRRYAEAYLRNHRGINQGMTLLVRQLPPEEHGLPIEIYCFTSTVAWSEYENIQADVFDHLLAAARHFELEVFQKPSGSDILQTA
ncbi:MAG TPA: mechanosensitive ion channel family protein, partial [Sphingobacteriaceae bacterium]